jgi:hypothetical protein
MLGRVLLTYLSLLVRTDKTKSNVDQNLGVVRAPLAFAPHKLATVMQGLPIFFTLWKTQS